MDLFKQIRKMVQQERCGKSTDAAILSALDLWEHREQDSKNRYKYRFQAWKNGDTLRRKVEGKRSVSFPIIFGWALSVLELGFYDMAEEIFRQIPEPYPLPGFQEICRFHRTFPAGNFSYAAFVPQMWEAFCKKEPAIARALDAGDYRKAFPPIASVFQTQTNELPLSLAEQDGIYQLQFGVANAPENIFPLIYLEEHVPATLAKKWRVRAGMEVALNQQVVISGTPYSLSQFQFTLEKRPNGQPGIIHVYNEALANLDAQNSAEAQAAAKQAVCCAVGEIPALYALRAIEVAEKAPGRSTPTLDQLHEVLGESTDLRMSARSALERSLTSAYSLTPSAGLRSDILVNLTCFPEILQEYQAGRSAQFNNLLSQGVAAGFVFFPAEVCPEITTVHLELPNQINEAAGKEIFITGTANGTTYCYIDFVAFDFCKVIAALKQVLDRLPGGEAAQFASFYPGAKPTSLDAEKELAAHRAAMERMIKKA